jgi:subtilisin family serine protease
VATSCDAPDDTWLTSVREHSKARVVNLSFSVPQMSARADFLPLVRRIRETRASFLWVAAAANRGLNLYQLADMSDASVPQILTEEPNLIKVAQGSARDGLAALSNYGPRSVDLAAPAPDRAGTSFSAPRVTGLAAQIQAKFPDLTPNQVKKTILFSVDWPREQPLKVSSGGEMNPTRALSMATRIAQKPGLSDLDWILETYCGSTTSKPCAEAQKRIQYWRRTLLLLSETSSNSRRLK